MSSPATEFNRQIRWLYSAFLQVYNQVLSKVNRMVGRYPSLRSRVGCEHGSEKDISRWLQHSTMGETVYQ